MNIKLLNNNKKNYNRILNILNNNLYLNTNLVCGNCYNNKISQNFKRYCVNFIVIFYTYLFD